MNIVRSKHNKQVFKLPNRETGLFSKGKRHTKQFFCVIIGKNPLFHIIMKVMVITRNSIHVQRHAILFAYFRKEPFKNAFLLKALVNISSLKKSASWKFQNINSQLSRNVIIENFIKF